LDWAYAEKTAAQNVIIKKNFFISFLLF